MKYEILIEGGFTGIPKEYTGEIELKEEAKKTLIEAFDRPSAPENGQLRDGLQYRLKLEDGDRLHEVSFTEQDLPLTIRQFIATLTKRA